MLMLMVMPVQAIIRNRIPASRRLPKFQVLIDFNCAANLGGLNYQRGILIAQGGGGGGR